MWKLLLVSLFLMPLGTPSVQQRFVVKGNEVRDKETHLIWELVPSAKRVLLTQAHRNCAAMGKRVPTMKELLSLVDFTQFNPALPPGNPFNTIKNSLRCYWWTSTPQLNIVRTKPNVVWLVDFWDGYTTWLGPLNTACVWCVRNQKK